MTDRSALGARAIRAIDDRQAQLFALSQAIHADPEPGYQEHRAIARLAAVLTECGFAVTRGYGGVETAYRADAAGRDGGPTKEVDNFGQGRRCFHPRVTGRYDSVRAGPGGL